MADNDWMYSGRISANERTADWEWKTKYFVKDANRGSKLVRPLCPCARCNMNHRQGPYGMTTHLWQYGYMPNFAMPTNFPERDRVRGEVMRQRINGNEDDGIGNMLHDLQYAEMAHSPPREEDPEGPDESEEPNEPEEMGELEEPEAIAKAFLDMMASAKKPLYPNATISQLDAVSQLLADKAKNGWNRAGYENNLKTLANMLPEGHCLPRNMYESKKIMKALCMDYEKIHCCPKGCLLFRKEFADHTHCSKCGASRFLEVKGADGQMKDEDEEEEEEEEEEQEDEQEELQEEGRSEKTGALWVRGPNKLPDPPREAERTRLEPTKTNFRFVDQTTTRRRIPGAILTSLLKKYWLGLYKICHGSDEKKLATKWEDYEAAMSAGYMTDESGNESVPSVAQVVHKKFWEYYTVEEELEDKSNEVFDLMERGKVQQMIYDARKTCISHYYAEQGERKLKGAIVKEKIENTFDEV
uniref:Uncharacterized protein n=1 Tax=Avena sativa TaxID=4498 RepID=A0ACD5XP76_AVESA